MKCVIQGLIPFYLNVISPTLRNFRNVLVCLGKLWVLIPDGTHRVDKMDALVKGAYLKYNSLI